MLINLNSKIDPISGVHVSQLSDSAVALNLNNENYYGLNPTAFKMYQTLIASKDISEALDQLSADFLVAEEELKTDLLDLITELETNGLISISLI